MKSDSDATGSTEHGAKQAVGKKPGMCSMWPVPCKCVSVMVGGSSAVNQYSILGYGHVSDLKMCQSNKRWMVQEEQGGHKRWA